MNSSKARALVRQTSVATLLAVAALSLCGCSTTSVSLAPEEKTVTYKELHSLMVKLASEPSVVASSASKVAALPTASGSLGASAILASNP